MSIGLNPLLFYALWESKQILCFCFISRIYCLHFICMYFCRAMDPSHWRVRLLDIVEEVQLGVIQVSSKLSNNLDSSTSIGKKEISTGTVMNNKYLDPLGWCVLGILYVCWAPKEKTGYEVKDKIALRHVVFEWVESLLAPCPFNWPEGILFQNPFGLGPWWALYHFATMMGLGSFLCPGRFFYMFINAESMVSTFNNTIEVKVSIHECIFWGCSADTFWEYNLSIFDHRIYP